MFTPVEFLLGWRYTQAERRGGFLSFIALIAMAGVALGMVALITILSIMNGFELELRDRLLGLSPHVSLRATDSKISDWQNIQRMIGNIQGVSSVAPIIEREVMVTHLDQVQGARLQGISGVNDPRFERIESKMLGEGLAALTPGGFSIILGEGLASAMRVDVGDHVTVVASKPTRTPAGLLPRLKRFQVIGIFAAGVQEFDTAFAFINIDDAAKLFRLANSVTSLQLRIDNVDEAHELKNNISTLLNDSSAAGTVRVFDWTDDNENLFKALKTEKIVMFVVLALAIGVAAFNLLSTLAMLVADKRGEIAILRTLGMSRRRIVLAFFAHGGVIGITGVGVGTAIGILLASNVAAVVAWLENTLGFKILAPDVYYISDIPSQLEHQDIVFTVVIALMLCLLAPLYPAYNASRVEPAQVLRYE